MSGLSLKGHKKKWLLSFVGPSLLVVILANINLDSLVEHIRQIDPLTIVWSSILAVLVIFVKGVRWHLLTIAYGISISYRSSIFLNFEGAFWGGITPGRIGEFIKAKRIQELTRGKILDGVILCSLDKLFDLLVVVITLLVSGYFVAPEFLLMLGIASIDRALQHLLTVVTVFVGIALLSLFLLLSMRKKLGEILFSVRRYSFLSCLGLFLISFVSLFIYIWAVYTIASTVWATVSFAQATFFVTLTMIVGALPLTIGNIGTRDAVAIIVLGMWGVDMEGAIAVSLMMLFLYLVATFGSWSIYRANPVKR